MDLYPLFFIAVFIFGSILSLTKDPLWGLLTYVFVYFNIPAFQWWGYQVPDLRWSLVSAIILLISCFFHKQKLSNLPWMQNPVGKWLIAFLALMVLILPFTPFPAQSARKVYDFLRYVLIFFVLGKVLSDFRRYKAFLGVFLFCTFYLAILAHHYFRGNRLDGVGLPDGSDANMLAALLLLVIPLFLAFGLTERGWQRLVAFGAIPFVLNAFVMCGSRGAFLGLMFQGALAIWLLRKHVGIKKMIAGCAIVLFGLLWLMSDQYWDRLVGMQAGIENESFKETSAGRWEVWQYGLNMAGDYPLGAGGGSFMSLSTIYLPDHLIEKRVGVRASHNTYLCVLVEQGVMGIILYFGFIWSQFYYLNKVRKELFFKQGENGDDESKKIIFHSCALQISLAGFWVSAFFLDRIYCESIYLMVGLVPVLSLSVKNRCEKMKPAVSSKSDKYSVELAE